MNDREAQRVRVSGASSPDALVGAPREPGEDQRRVGHRDRTRGDSSGGAPDVLRSNPAHPATRPDLQAVRRSRPVRVPDPPARSAAFASRVGSILGLGGRLTPPAPATSDRLRAERDLAAPLPVQADQIEAWCDRLPASRHVTCDRRQPGAERRRRQGEERAESDEEDLMGGGASYGTRDRLRPQGCRAFPDRILTSVKGPLCGHFSSSPVWLRPWFLLASGAPDRPRVLEVVFENDVNPVTADYVIGEIERANDEGYDAVVIQLDTPGGLSEAMRDIYKKELRLDPGDRLRRARGSARRLRRSLDRPGGRCPGDGAADEPRLVDADLVGRRGHPVRSQAEGDQRRGETAARPGRGARAQRRLGRAGRSKGGEPHRARGTAQ